MQSGDDCIPHAGMRFLTCGNRKCSRKSFAWKKAEHMKTFPMETVRETEMPTQNLKRIGSHTSLDRSWKSFWKPSEKYLIEGSLEVKLPTIWTDEKQSREEAERRERLEERRVRRKKMQMREKVGKSRNTVFFQ